MVLPSLSVMFGTGFMLVRLLCVSWPYRRPQETEDAPVSTPLNCRAHVAPPLSWSTREPGRSPVQARDVAIAGATATATRAARPTFIRSKGMNGRTPAARAAAGGRPARTESQVAHKE